MERLERSGGERKMVLWEGKEERIVREMEMGSYNARRETHEMTRKI